MPNGDPLDSFFYPKVSEYDQEIPQSHTTDQPTAPQGRATENLQLQYICKTIIAN